LEVYLEKLERKQEILLVTVNVSTTVFRLIFLIKTEFIKKLVLLHYQDKKMALI